MDITTLSECKYLSVNSVAKRFDVNKSTIWRWVNEGHFPTPVRFGGSTRWNIESLEKYEIEQTSSSHKLDKAS